MNRRHYNDVILSDISWNVELPQEAFLAILHVGKDGK
jgi:hypothetical protein